MHRSPLPLVRLACCSALLLTLAACGSSGSKALPTGTLPTTSADTATTVADAASTTASSVGGSSKCGTSADVAATTLTGAADVTEVKIIGGCMVSVATKLQPGNDGATAALALCDKLAAVVYDAGAKSISIDSAVGHELAAGIAGSQCIGEP